MKREESELTVITRAKELCMYVLAVTDKSPKKFRFTLVSRLQNYSLDIIQLQGALKPRAYLPSP